MNYKAMMSPKEIAFIEKYLTKDKVMLEWGAGGSTLYFSQLVKEYYSIEHNPIWWSKIKNSARYLEKNNINIFNAKNDMKFTIPSEYNQFKKYINYIDKIGISKYDIILIDGRARQWCAEKALKYIDSNSIIFIHDYFNRDRYKIIEKWYNIMDGIEDTEQTIVALRSKEH